VIAGALVILKDLKFRSRLSDLMFLMVLALWVGYITVAMLLPVISISSSPLSAG